MGLYPCIASPMLLSVPLVRSDEKTEFQTNSESDGTFGLCTRNRAKGELITGGGVLAFGKFQSMKTEARG